MKRSTSFLAACVIAIGSFVLGCGEAGPGSFDVLSCYEEDGLTRCPVTAAQEPPSLDYDPRFLAEVSPLESDGELALMSDIVVESDHIADMASSPESDEELDPVRRAHLESNPIADAASPLESDEEFVPQRRAHLESNPIADAASPLASDEEFVPQRRAHLESNPIADLAAAPESAGEFVVMGEFVAESNQVADSAMEALTTPERIPFEQDFEQDGPEVDPVNDDAICPLSYVNLEGEAMCLLDIVVVTDPSGVPVTECIYEQCP